MTDVVLLVHARTPLCLDLIALIISYLAEAFVADASATLDYICNCQMRKGWRGVSCPPVLTMHNFAE
mgnify:FL=1